MAKKKAAKKTTDKKKTTKKKVAASTLSSKLEKTIEKDFQACEELLRSGTGRNEWVEENCKRMKSWQEAAEAGDARGQVLCGLCFYYGHGAKEDDKKAVAWFTKSAEQGNAQGQFGLGQCYYNGQGVKEDEKKAVKWFTKAAEQGHEEAKTSIPVEKVLTQEIAEQFLEDEDSVDLYEFTAIDEDAVESLSKHEGDLSLDGLRSLSDADAESLSKFRGDLSLDGLRSLSDADAESLSKFRGDLSLDGLRSLSDAAARSLSKHEGGLSLGGLTSLSDEVANNLSQAVGNLQLPSAGDLLAWKKEGNNISEKAIIQAEKQDAIDELIGNVDTVGSILSSNHNEESAHKLYAAISRFRTRMTLARNRGHINAAIAEELLELEENYQERDDELEIPPGPLSDPNMGVLQNRISIDDAAAEVLIKHKGNLNLNGLTSLSDAAAQSLSKHKGGLYLNSLTSLSDAAAESLSKHKGGTLSLKGLTSLSDAAAESLSKHEILGVHLGKLPESAAAILRSHPSFADQD